MKFVSKDLALKLKKKGFDRSCFGWYDAQIIENNMLYLNITKGDGDYKDLLEYTNDFEWIIDAPTIDQVLEWLREDKRIGLWATPYFIDAYTFAWRWNVSYFEGEELFIPNIVDFDTYEDACIAGIEYVINNLI